MRQLTPGLGATVLAVTVLAVTGCAAASPGSGKAPAAGTSPGTSQGTAATPSRASSASAAAAAAAAGLGVNPGGPAQWVVRGTFKTQAGAQPMSGTVTFRDNSTGRSVNVTVGASGTFSLGLTAGTYTVTGQPGSGATPCSASSTMTVQAGHVTTVSLVCKAS